MSATIKRVEVVACTARMAMADVAELLAVHEGNLPARCFLHDLAVKGPDANGDVALGPAVEWCGVWSDQSYFKVLLPHVAPKVRGALDLIMHWDDYPPSGLRIRDGKVTEPAVKLSLEDA